MASLLYTILCLMMMLLACIYCSPIKRSATDQQATDCYGTECYFDPDYFNTDTIVNVNFPENLTQVVLSVLPLIPDMMEKHDQQIQNLTAVVTQLVQNQLTQIGGAETEMSNTMTQMAATQNQVSNAMTQIASTENQASNTLTQIGNTETQMASTLTQIAATQNQISNAMTQIASSQSQTSNTLTQMAELLQSQLSILSERLPLPTLLPPLPPPRDCQDIAATGSSQSGVYTITPLVGLESFRVYCDFDTDVGGWTVFQKRFDGSIDFFLGWEQYEEGFGNSSGEYWLGLTNMHRLTKNHNWILRIDFEAFDGGTAYAVYDSFSVGDASSNYRLTLGTYSGTAGDALAQHNNMAFSTKDRDNDIWGDNCANVFKGGWWYHACHDSNLNGLYLGSRGNSNIGNRWNRWKGSRSLKRTEMKIRRVG